VQQEFLVFGEASATAQVLNNPATEPKRPVRRSLGEGGSQKQKRPLFIEPPAHRYSCSGNALV
jgi:hypothetical protein